MGNSIGESWDARIRERARQYAARTEDRDDLQNWNRAKEELWHETLAGQRPLALRLNWMRENLDEGTEEGLRAAASTGCQVMRMLVDSSAIIDELYQKAGKLIVDQSRTDISDYLDFPALLDDFLAVECKILIRTGLSPASATELCALLRAHQQTIRQDTLQTDIIPLLNKAVERACLPYGTTIYAPGSTALGPKHPHALFRSSMRVLWRIGAGGLVVGANAAALVAVGDVTAEISKALGAAVIGSGITALIG